MKVLRSSMYSSMNAIPVTGIVLESDLSVPVDVWSSDQLKYGAEHGALIVLDAFEVPEGTDIMIATRLAAERCQKAAEDEANMSVLYFWTVGLLPQVRQGGSVASKRPAPLDAAQVETVFRQLSAHAAYRGQMLLSGDRSGTIVILKDGVISHG